MRATTVSGRHRRGHGPLLRDGTRAWLFVTVGARRARDHGIGAGTVAGMARSYGMGLCHGCS